MKKHCFSLICVVPALFAGMAFSDEMLTVESFNAIHHQIKPQPGESRWLEISWLIDLHAARVRAATEGKPLFVMSGGGATAIGPC